jgi:UDP-GlcNAc:undecaprenyl-phosphate GlcNAc-1-phosphate transferase
MNKFIPVILASGLISFIATPLVRRLAQRVNFVDNPQARKMHITPMPMLGGVAIYLGLIASVVLGGLQDYSEMFGVMGAATVITLVGLWDDRRELSPGIKLLGQIAATAILIAVGIQVNIFRIEWLNVAITLLWVIGICNAINFQDNMDGLAAGLATVTSGFFFMLATIEGLGLVATLGAATLGASIGFLYYNFNPASLFMGDAGSLLLGFMLAVLGIKLEFTGRPIAATWMIPIIILGVPIFDTTLVVISRLRRGRHIYEGGKDHTSHRLVSILGMSHARSVMTLYLVSAALGLTAIMLRDATPFQARLLLAGLAAAFVFALVWLEAKFKPVSGPAPMPESDPTSD